MIIKSASPGIDDDLRHLKPLSQLRERLRQCEKDQNERRRAIDEHRKLGAELGNGFRAGNQCAGASFLDANGDFLP